MGKKVQSKEAILELLRKNREKIISFGVIKMGLFGSFLTNDFTSKSDVDFLVEFDTGEKTYDNFMNLSFFLENLLGRKVEIVTPQALSPYIGPYILKQAEYVQI